VVEEADVPVDEPVDVLVDALVDDLVDDLVVDGEAVVASEDGASRADGSVPEMVGELLMGPGCNIPANWTGSCWSRWGAWLPSELAGTIAADRCSYSLNGTSDAMRTLVTRAMSSGSGFESGRNDTIAAIAAATAPMLTIVLVRRFHHP
jgi:hypothetical protein